MRFKNYIPSLLYFKNRLRQADMKIASIFFAKDRSIEPRPWNCKYELI